MDPVLTYFRAVSVAEPYLEITMLATGDDDADVVSIMAETRRAAWKGGALVSKWVSQSRGGEKAADGKDKFRGHQRKWIRALN